MSTDPMGTDIDAAATSENSRLLDALAHGSSLIVGVVASVIAGQPVGWIAFLLPLGPLLVVGVASFAHTAPRGTRSLLAFTTMSTLVIGGGYALTFAGELWGPLALLYPLGILAFIAGLVNWLMIVVSRVWRALRGWRFDYPWIPRPLARIVGLPDDWEE